MKTEIVTPSRKQFMFLLLPVIGFEKFHNEYSFAVAWLCWGFSITFDNDDLDRFDNFMNNVFRRTNPQMWFAFILVFIILANLL